MAVNTKLFRNQQYVLNVSWFPLLILALTWLLALFCRDYFSIQFPWPILAVGGIAYLLTLAAFVIFGDRESPGADASTRIATALSMGTAAALAFYVWTEWPMNHLSANAPHQPGSDPVNTVNVFAAILGVVLTAIALIAQKSATEARTEAEKARRDILGVYDIKDLVLSSQLLERAQVAKFESEEMTAEAYETSELDELFARFLHSGAEGLASLGKFLMSLQKWLLEPQLTSSNDLICLANKLKIDLHLLVEIPRSNLEHDRKQRLRVEFWQPTSRLIEKLLLQGLPYSAKADDSERVAPKLRELCVVLKQL